MWLMKQWSKISDARDALKYYLNINIALKEMHNFFLLKKDK